MDTGVVDGARESAWWQFTLVTGQPSYIARAATRGGCAWSGRPKQPIRYFYSKFPSVQNATRNQATSLHSPH